MEGDCEVTSRQKKREQKVKERIEERLQEKKNRARQAIYFLSCVLRIYTIFSFSFHLFSVVSRIVLCP